MIVYCVFIHVSVDFCCCDMKTCTVTNYTEIDCKEIGYLFNKKRDRLYNLYRSSFSEAKYANFKVLKHRVQKEL